MRLFFLLRRNGVMYKGLLVLHKITELIIPDEIGK